MDEFPEWAVDAADIPDTACVLRRVPPSQIENYLPTTQNFRERDSEPTTGLSVTYWQSDIDLQDVIRIKPDFGVVSIVVADIRSRGLILARVALVGNLNHCEIFGNITPSMRKQFKLASRWVRPPSTLDPALFEPFDIHQATRAPRVSLTT